MAKHHPPMRPRRPDTNKAEIAVWDALSELPNSWHVYHSVPLWEIGRKSSHDKEIDFVLVHRQHGIVVLEVKAGAPKVEDGQWYQRDTDTRQWKPKQSPFEQIKGNAYTLKRKLNGLVAGLGDLPIARAVVFPEASRSGYVGIDHEEAMLLGSDEVLDIATSVDALAPTSHWGLAGDKFNEIHQLLAPTVEYRLTVASQIGQVEAEILQLTEDQIRTIRSLRRIRRGLVYGGAGTGKTILAAERAEDLAANGATVLLTCFNKPLGEMLADRVTHPNIKAMHRDGYAYSLLKRAQLVVPERLSRQWYEEQAPELFATAIDRLEISFDAVIIDEGQDFSDAWMTGLQLLLNDPDDGPFFVFADPEQCIYHESWSPPFDVEPFVLDENCRNSKPIAKRCASVLETPFESRGSTGPEPEFLVSVDDETSMDLLSSVVGRLTVDEQVLPDGIVILSDRRQFVDGLVGQSLGGCVVSSTPGSGVAAETIHRFKGLESPVVIAVIHDAAELNGLRVAYIGMSRAKAHLVVIGSLETRKQLSW